MFKFKIPLIIALITILFIFTNTAEAKGIQGPQGPDGQQGPEGKKGPVGSKGFRGDKGQEGAEGPRGQTGEVGQKGDTGPKGDVGALNPLSQIFTCGDSTALVGVWFRVVEAVVSKSISECSIKIDASLNLTGYCHDPQSGVINAIKNGTATFSSNCSVGFTINFKDGGSSTSRAFLNRAGDTLVGNFHNSTGNYGPFPAIKGDIGEVLVGMDGPAGGVIFYLTDGGRHGLEAAPVDQTLGSGVAWGCDSKSIGTSAAVGTGAKNTTAIVNGCSDTESAAKIADDYILNGYSDWYLPSENELALLLNASVVSGLQEYEQYWSSTESGGNTRQYAYSRFPNSNSSYSSLKYYLQQVRAIRSY